MYQSNQSLKIPPPTTSFAAREGGNLIASFDFMLRRVDSTWRDKSWRRQALMHSKRKRPDSWRTGWKVKACTNFALYLKVFKNHFYYLRHIRMLSIKSCLHTQLPEHNRRYWKVSRRWGHLITWNGPTCIMGHLNSFSASGGGEFEQKFSKNSNARGIAQGGGGCLSFDLTGT